MNPWIPWEVHASPHDLDGYAEDPFPVVDTELGRLGVAICYDWLFPETIRQIAFNGAEVIVRVSAYMDPWGATPPMDWWTLFNRARALENTAYVVAANQGASLRTLPAVLLAGRQHGRRLRRSHPGPGRCRARREGRGGARRHRGLRHERERRVGHDMRAHLRSEIYPYLQQPYLAPATAHPLTSEEIRARIKQGKQRNSECLLNGHGSTRKNPIGRMRHRVRHVQA